ncbi:MAG: hypothetical protein ACE5FS_02525 [Paracoccaceae bacterium]
MKFLLFLVVLALVVVVVYAVFFDLPPPEREITIPLQTDGE